MTLSSSLSKDWRLSRFIFVIVTMSFVIVIATMIVAIGLQHNSFQILFHIILRYTCTIRIIIDRRDVVEHISGGGKDGELSYFVWF